MAGMWLKRELKAIVSRRNEGGGVQTHTAGFQGDANMISVPIGENTIGSG